MPIAWHAVAKLEGQHPAIKFRILVVEYSRMGVATSIDSFASRMIIDWLPFPSERVFGKAYLIFERAAFDYVLHFAFRNRNLRLKWSINRVNFYPIFYHADPSDYVKVRRWSDQVLRIDQFT